MLQVEDYVMFSVLNDNFSFSLHSSVELSCNLEGPCTLSLGVFRTLFFGRALLLKETPTLNREKTALYKTTLNHLHPTQSMKPIKVERSFLLITYSLIKAEKEAQILAFV